MKHKIVYLLHHWNFSLKQIKPKMVIKLQDIFKDWKILNIKGLDTEMRRELDKSSPNDGIKYYI